MSVVVARFPILVTTLCLLTNPVMVVPMYENGTHMNIFMLSCFTIAASPECTIEAGVYGLSISQPRAR